VSIWRASVPNPSELRCCRLRSASHLGGECAATSGAEATGNEWDKVKDTTSGLLPGDD
jgi:hypothetical protein